MMRNLPAVLDECLRRIATGETVEQCLADYPKLHAELEPLLRTAHLILSVPKVTPSENYRLASRERIVARLRLESQSGINERFENRVKDGIASVLRGVDDGLRVKLVTAVALVILLTVSFWLIIPRSSSPLSPTPAIAAECILSLFNGTTEVQGAKSTDWNQGNDRLKLFTGDRVKTNSDSYSMLTFIDGSTVKLESDADIIVLLSEYKDQQSARINLYQKSGKIWTNVQNGGQSASELEIQTPAARIAAYGASFATEVDSTGITRVAVAEGKVSVIALDTKVVLLANQQTQVAPGIAPVSPQSIPVAKNKILLSTGATSVSSVINPNGSSTGYLPNGLSFNQITNSKSSLSSDGQNIEIVEPKPGEYTIVVRSLEDAAPVSLQIQSEGKTISEFSEVLKGNHGKGWLIHLKLDINSNFIINSNILGVESLGDQKLENVVETSISQERAKPNSTTPTTNSVTTFSPTPQEPTHTASPNPTQMATSLPINNTPVQDSLNAETSNAPNSTPTPASPYPTQITTPLPKNTTPVEDSLNLEPSDAPTNTSTSAPDIKGTEHPSESKPPAGSPGSHSPKGGPPGTVPNSRK